MSMHFCKLGLEKEVHNTLGYAKGNAFGHCELELFFKSCHDTEVLNTLMLHLARLSISHQENLDFP